MFLQKFGVPTKIHGVTFLKTAMLKTLTVKSDKNAHLDILLCIAVTAVP